MAVTKEPTVDNQGSSSSDPRSGYSIRVYILIAIVQFAFFLVSYGVLELLGITSIGWLAYFGLSLISATWLSLVTTIIIYIHNKSPHDPSQSTIPAVPETPVARLDTTDADVVYDGIKNMSSGLVILDRKGHILYSNAGVPTTEDAEGRPRLNLHFPEHDSLKTWLHKVRKNELKADKSWTRVANKLPREKDRKIYDVTASFRKNSTAEVILMIFDRTNAYNPEEDDLDFISFAAHELRGPITVIRGYLDVLQDELDPKLTDDQRELLSRLIVSTNRLTSYVNNILNTSRYDRRHLKLRLVEEKVSSIYDLISDDMHMRAKTQNRLLVTEIPHTLPTVAADISAASEVISNLIDNAIKYSNEGGLVHVTAKAIPKYIEISVTDRGIGMPENVLPNLFHKFYRSHRSRETVAGTGIGLYICKAIVNSHGGTITARSIVNEGSTFSFTLPIYDTVAEKIGAHNNSNESLIEHGSGWIRNHSMFRG